MNIVLPAFLTHYKINSKDTASALLIYAVAQLFPFLT